MEKEGRDKEALDLAVKAGQILLDAGAEIYRVEETVQRIARAYGIRKCNTFGLSTGIFVTAEMEDHSIYAQVKHMPLNAARLHRVAAVNQLSREIEEGKHTIEDARNQLAAIEHMPGKRDITRIFASGLGSAGFCYVLEGTIADTTAAFFAGLFVYVLLILLEKRKKQTSKIVLNIIGGFWAALLTMIFFRIGIGQNYESILVGTLMPLVPGVSFVNAIRDFADADYIGGAVRLLDALLVALGISLGVGLMYMLYYRITGGMLL